MPDVRELATSKQFLRTSTENNYEIPTEIDSFAFACALLANLASTDEELRDELSYMFLASGIIDRHKLTVQQVGEFLHLVLDKEHLFYHIGETGTDSVFMRSFSSLIVAGIIYTDSRNPALPQRDIHIAKDTLLHYAHEEQDWRGYVEGKGWAHAMAHLADALDECAQHQSMSAGDRQEILKNLSGLVKLPEPLYHEEDMRLAAIAYHIIACKQVSDEFLTAWIANCYVERDSDVSVWMSASNVKNFLRSLYFLLFWDSMALSITDQISDILKKQDEIYLATRN
jgi:Protein of unknown function (DUF2785)